jgi:hypothetical protein
MTPTPKPSVIRRCVFCLHVMGEPADCLCICHDKPKEPRRQTPKGT